MLIKTKGMMQQLLIITMWVMMKTSFAFKKATAAAIRSSKVGMVMASEIKFINWDFIPDLSLEILKTLTLLLSNWVESKWALREIMNGSNNKSWLKEIVGNFYGSALVFIKWCRIWRCDLQPLRLLAFSYFRSNQRSASWWSYPYQLPSLAKPRTLLSCSKCLNLAQFIDYLIHVSRFCLSGGC